MAKRCLASVDVVEWEVVERADRAVRGVRGLVRGVAPDGAAGRAVWGVGAARGDRFFANQEACFMIGSSSGLSMRRRGDGLGVISDATDSRLLLDGLSGTCAAVQFNLGTRGVRGEYNGLR